MHRNRPTRNCFGQQVRSEVGTAVLAGALAAPMAHPASAQIVVAPGGLVNVQIVDVIDDINVNAAECDTFCDL